MILSEIIIEDRQKLDMTVDSMAAFIAGVGDFLEEIKDLYPTNYNQRNAIDKYIRQGEAAYRAFGDICGDTYELKLIRMEGELPI